MKDRYPTYLEALDIIDELKQELNRYKGTKLEDYSNEIRELKKQLEVADKALELACKYKLPPDGSVTVRFCDTGFQTSSYEELIAYCKQQAEKEIKEK